MCFLWNLLQDCEAEIADGMDYSDVPYVHQAFLADWRPDTSTLNYSERISSTSLEVNLGHDAISQDIQLYRGINNYGLSGNVQHQNGNQPAFPSAYKLPLLFHSTSGFRSGMKGTPSATIPKNPVFGATSSSKYYCRPYRARRANTARLVKLAPDLPPVNLPPSVRVVSETAFKGFPCGTSKNFPPGGGVTDVRKDNSASQIPHGEKIGIDHRAGARSMPKDSVVGSQVERSETAEGRSVVAEKAAHADLQMHPLLFQVTEEGQTPYYPFKFSSGPSSSFSFFSGRQPQLNLSLFSSSLQQGHIDRANKSLKSKNSSLRLGGIDFHPLLQKSNDTQAQSGSDDIQAESLVNNSGVPDTTDRSSGLNDKSNELDLDIHLCSVSEGDKSMKSRQLKEHDPIASCETAINAPYCQHGGRNPSPSRCELASNDPLVAPEDNITRYDVDDVGDQSHPGIVMEQEELSDSEEEIEEHVEFECEEMADSEGEDGSGCEQTPEVQNKVAALFFAVSFRF